MPVKLAGLRQLFLFLRGHLGAIRCAWLAARTKLATRHLIFGFAFFFGNFLMYGGSERTTCAAKEPTEPERNGNCGIGLRFDRIAECALQ